MSSHVATGTDRARVVTAKNMPGMRSAGSPTATAARPATTIANSERDEQVGAVLDEQGGGRGAADAGERELAEADLSGPASQHDQRHGQQAEDDQRGGERELRRAEPGRHRDDEHGAAERERVAGQAHLGERSEDAVDGSHVADRGVGAEVAAADAFVAAALQEQRGEHDGEHGDVDGRRAGRVPEEHLAEHAERDGGADSHAELVHAGDDRRRDGHQQRFGSGDGAEVGAEDGCREHGGDAGQAGGDHPGDA